MVKSIVEIANLIWYPNLNKSIVMLENVLITTEESLRTL